MMHSTTDRGSVHAHAGRRSDPNRGHRHEGHDPGRRSGSRLLTATVLATVAVTLTALVPARADAAPTSIAVTSRVSVRTDGSQLPTNSDTVDINIDDLVSISGNGRYVAFSTNGSMQADDIDAGFDVYLRDRVAGTTTRVSLTDADGPLTGTGPSNGAHVCGMSDDARYIGFWASASNLPGGLGGQIYLRDRAAKTTELVSASTAGTIAGSVSNGGIDPSQPCPISTNGRYIAFTSQANNLVAGDGNSATDVFRRDRTATETVLVSVDSSEVGVAAASTWPAMTNDGNQIAFESGASTLAPNDTNAKTDIFVRRASQGDTFRLSVSSTSVQADGESHHPALSGDGQIVAYSSTAQNLVDDDDSTSADIFVRNRTTGNVELVSKSSNGTQSATDDRYPSLSDDGRYVGFSSNAPSLYPLDANGNYDAFRHDRTTHATDLISRTATTNFTGNHYSGLGASISDDGTAAAFISASSDLVRNDTDGHWDVFVRDFKTELTPFASAESFAKQQFADFQGREPTSAELAEWKTKVLHGELSPDGAIDALAHGTTWAGKRAPLTRLYWAFFLRTPDLGGMDYWVGRLKAGRSLASVAKQFAASSEFQTKYGSKTNEQFVTLIYQNIFERNPDAAGLAFWTKRLDDKTKTRGDVMVNFSESGEGKRVLAPQTDVVVIWLGMMRTMPSSALFTASVANLKAGTPPETFAESVRNQPEYAARVTS